MGEQLYSIVSAGLSAEAIQVLKDHGFYNEQITAGKLTGMILENRTTLDMVFLLADYKAVTELMVEACLVLAKI